MTDRQAQPEKSASRPLTNKELQLLDYMRGNGSRLTPEAWSMFAGFSWWTPRGLSQVLGRLQRDGLVEHPGPPGEHPYELTAAGRRASEDAHR